MNALNRKYLFLLLMVFAAVGVSAQKAVRKYNATMKVQNREIAGLLIQTATDSSNRFIFIGRLGLKFFDVETGNTTFNYKIHYFSPVFKNEKRVLGIAKEMFVLGIDNKTIQQKSSPVKKIKLNQGICKSSFGLFGRRVKVCDNDTTITVRCKFYPVLFELKALK